MPVTVLTGFLGAGKTTLLNRILSQSHGRRYAVIVNEFAAVGIDHELLVGGDEELFEMNNGCVCCTVRGDLIRTLHALLARPGRFDAVVIETTGLANPGPVAQTFFVDAHLRLRTRLDSITTVVDARHFRLRLATSREAQEQVAFADQIVLNKTDLEDEAALREVEAALRRINPLAPIRRAERADVALDALLGCGGFDLQRIVSLAPAFLNPRHGEPGHVHAAGDEFAAGHDHGEHDREHDHDHADGTGSGAGVAPAAPLHGADIVSVSLVSQRPMDAGRVEHWLGGLVASRGADILRAKGIVDIAGDDRRLVFQSVHMLLDGDWQRAWRAGELRQSRLVFIGRGLDAAALRAGFDGCAAQG